MGAILRSAVFVDGFNLYHALKRLQMPHIKWLDLHKLAQRLIAPQSEILADVYYFSAYADWLPQQKKRHEAYVAALENAGVKVILGQFKNKDKICPHCHYKWRGHEEKETDVNIALYLLNEANKGDYDCAYVISRDSDLKPAMRMVKENFPEKKLITVAPPHMRHSTDLISVADAKQKITLQQVEDCLFPAQIFNDKGELITVRPPEYAPPRG